jgi:hypothetical protein
VNAGWFDDAGSTHRLPKRTLQGILRRVVTSFDAGARVDGAARRREHVLPAPLPFGTGILPRQGERQMNASATFAKIVLMQRAYAHEMIAQRFEQVLRQQSNLVLLSLGVADEQLTVLKVDVLDAKSKALEQAQSATINQRRHEPRGPLQLGENRPDLIARKYYRQALWLLGALHVLEPGQLTSENVSI